jgi:Rrf2 family protein
VRLTARVDYALRAVCALAAEQAAGSLAGGASRVPGSLTTERISAAEAVPQRFLEAILRDLRRSGIVASRRGPDGGHCLALPADQVSIADVIRAIDGPLALVRNLRPEQLEYSGSSLHLQDVWIALRASEREILESTTVDAVVAGDLPDVARRHLAH